VHSKSIPCAHAQVHVCVLRALAEDENRAQRAQRGLDLALLDGVTWPEFLWDTLRVLGDPLGAHAACSGAHVAPAYSGSDPAPFGADAAAAVRSKYLRITLSLICCGCICVRCDFHAWSHDEVTCRP
jgi:hypothetical protein